MFSNTLTSSWDERSRRGLTTLTSLGLQALVVGLLLLLPLLRPMVLPLLHPLSAPVSLGQPLAQRPAAAPHAGANTVAPSNPADVIWRQPSRLMSVLPAADDDAAPALSGFETGTAGQRIGDPHGVQTGPSFGTQPVMPIIAPAPPAAPVRISHMNEGDLIHKVLPTYPPLARSARIQGTVLLRAMISKQGTIRDLTVLSGHPMLVSAAIEAVRQWRYRPYVLNNDPVEVETQITVTFSLAGN